MKYKSFYRKQFRWYDKATLPHYIEVLTEKFDLTHHN